MTGKQVFKDNFSKNVQSSSIFSKPKSMILQKDIEKNKKERYKLWITFFRRNPVRFIQTYFGITLYPYQQLMIWVLQRSNLGYIVASRAAAKTWILAVWSLTLCVLYPGIKVVVVAKTLNQGGLILREKMKSLMDVYPNVQREIRGITTNANVNECIFHNGSTIRIVPASESARGKTKNVLANTKFSHY